MALSQHGNSFAVCIVVVGPDDKTTVLVKDERMPHPQFWKLPGGKSEWGEEPQDAARRELREETGLEAEQGGLLLLAEEPRGSHTMYLFATRVRDFEYMKSRGDEGEIVARFDLSEIPGMMDFMPSHRRLLDRAGL